MRLLLDSHVVLWYDAASIRHLASQQAVRSATEIFVSSVTFWELSIKQHRSKLNLTRKLPELLTEAHFRMLPITAEHGIAAGELPLHHRDPFDRMLVAQAMLEGLTLVTHDRALERHDVPILLI